MRKLSTIFVIVLSNQFAFGSTVIPTDQVQVVSTNATNYGISFTYNPVSEWVTVTMPYKRGEMTFDEATLELTNATQRFSVPVKGMHLETALTDDSKPQDMLAISFRMDGQTLRESALMIYFVKGQETGVEYILRPKDFVAKREGSNN